MSEPCVYAAYAEDESVLYVGSTDNYGRRMEWHRACSPWVIDCWATEVVPFDTMAEARKAEKYVIGKLNPPWNWQSRTTPNPVPRPTLAESQAEVARRRSAPDYTDSAEFRAMREAMNRVADRLGLNDLYPTRNAVVA